MDVDVISIKELLKQLSQASDTQIDKTITSRLLELSEQEKPSADELKKILDECAHASLASDFAMIAMDAAWKGLQNQPDSKQPAPAPL